LIQPFFQNLTILKNIRVPKKILKTASGAVSVILFLKYDLILMVVDLLLINFLKRELDFVAFPKNRTL
jgi:hypothetical protein